MYGYIYEIRNKQTGDCYIGMTSLTPEERFEQHAQNDRGKNHFQKAIQKYGRESFEVSTLEKCSLLLLSTKEKRYIKEYREKGIRLYNSTNGGEGGDTTTNNPRGKELVARRTKTMREKYWGDPEWKAKLSTSLKGVKKKDTSKMKKPKSSEHREKLRQAALKQFSDKKKKDKWKLSRWGSLQS